MSIFEEKEEFSLLRKRIRVDMLFFFFSERAWCVGKQTGSHKKSLPCKAGTINQIID